MSSEAIHRHRRKFLPAAGHDLFLPFYDPVAGLLGFNQAQKNLIEQAKVQPSHRVLDIGCGTGSFVVLLRRQYAVAQVVGLDPDPKVLRRAQKKAKRAGVLVQLDQGFADALPYTDRAFDRVFSSFMFHHLEEADREKALREVVRVLKPAGSFHLVDFTGGENGSALERFVHSSDQMKDNAPEQVMRLLRRAGFTNTEKLKQDRMLFGLLKIDYYRAAA